MDADGEGLRRGLEIRYYTRLSYGRNWLNSKILRLVPGRRTSTAVTRFGNSATGKVARDALDCESGIFFLLLISCASTLMPAA